jgi:hypothetical protein
MRLFNPEFLRAKGLQVPGCLTAPAPALPDGVLVAQPTPAVV